jgi:hypothetical protein
VGLGAEQGDCGPDCEEEGGTGEGEGWEEEEEKRWVGRYSHVFGLRSGLLSLGMGSLGVRLAIPVGLVEDIDQDGFLGIRLFRY